MPQEAKSREYKFLMEFTVEIPPGIGLAGFLAIPDAIAATGLIGLGMKGTALVLTPGEAARLKY